MIGRCCTDSHCPRHLCFDLLCRLTLSKVVPTKTRADVHGEKYHCAFRGVFHSSAVKENRPINANIALGVHADNHDGIAPLWPSDTQKAAKTQYPKPMIMAIPKL